MTATCFLLINSLKKEIKKSLPDKAAAIDWLVTMSSNPRFLMGNTEDHTFAIATNFHLWPTETKHG